MLKGEWEGRPGEKIKVLQGPKRTRVSKRLCARWCGEHISGDQGLKGKTQMETLVYELPVQKEPSPEGLKSIAKAGMHAFEGRKDCLAE